MSRRSKSAVTAALERAALLGREFPLALLTASGVSEDELSACFDHGILAAAASPGHARFVRAADVKQIAAAVPWSRAREHHLALGLAAERQRLPAAAVAGHFEAAHRFDLARAQWLKAGETACAAGDYRAALDHIDRCLALWPWDEAADERVRVLGEMARCAANAGMPQAACKAWEELADYARECRHNGLLADALHHLAGHTEDPVRAGAFLAEAAMLDLPPADAYRHGLAYVEHLCNRVRVAAAREAFRRVESAAMASDRPALRSEMLGWKGLLAAMAGEAHEASSLVEESLRLAIDHQLPEQTAIAYKRRANIADYAGRYQQEIESHGIAIRYCQDVGDGSEVSCMSCLSYACFRTGDWREATATAREVLAGDGLHRGLKAIATAVLGMIAAFRGERGACARLEDSLQLQRACAMSGMELLTLWALASWQDMNGAPETATAIYDEIRSLWRETDDLHDVVPGLLFAGAHYADRGMSARLADCIDILNAIRQRNDLPECRAALLALGAEQAKLDGDLSRHDEALAEAAALEAKAGLPLEQLWIECRRGGGRQNAIAMATRLGVRPILARLKGGQAEAPTPRQREVLVHLAAGLTSKEIADRMRLSTRTVEMHVGRLLARFGCRTRPEAVAMAQSRGWLAGG